jgi:Glycosyltransferases involved in cell wall biogenesis
MKQNIFKISIILTFFNDDIFLVNRVLDSILLDFHEDYELIIVDDGSTDDSIGVKCKSIECDNIRYIYKKNGGVASARNLGLMESKGEFVTFIDGDDVYDIGYNKILDECALLNKDIVFLDYFVNSHDSKHHLGGKNLNFEKNKVIILRALFGEYYLFGSYAIGAVWNKLYKKSFLLRNNLFFDEFLRKAQDVEFNIRCIYKSNDYIYFKKGFYIYYVNKNSICHKKNDKLLGYYESFLKKLIIDKKQMLSENYGCLSSSINYSIIYCFESLLKINILFNNEISFFRKEKEAKKLRKYFDTKFDFKNINIFEIHGLKLKIKLFLFKCNLFFFYYLILKGKKEK